ncbi:putative Pentatricopeptide repeat domain containing protein [Klebsormidium nitens]|uniref:Putative Pentatricopeptide repeat domain containing protein n=1 Tax=Klebsormidium nitens TaxID=105231 RepID=A0A1Y1HPV6_KLENI|nr:putative Pentatricopeptide repeat domain containing protein [Klebsormidium nitens]|eukprot:GAQ80665.1 putative Pentatricopeptide repeat domain containing protein [Klebsormidium nitens]
MSLQVQVQRVLIFFLVFTFRVPLHLGVAISPATSGPLLEKQVLSKPFGDAANNHHSAQCAPERVLYIVKSFRLTTSTLAALNQASLSSPLCHRPPMNPATTARALGRGHSWPRTNCPRQPQLLTQTASPLRVPSRKLRTWTDCVSGLSLRPYTKTSKTTLPATPPKKIVCMRRSAKRRKRENEAKMKIIVAEQRAKRSAEIAAARQAELERRMAPPKPKRPPVQRKLSDLARVAVDHILATEGGGQPVAQACRIFEDTVDLLGWEGVIKELAAQGRLDLSLGVFRWLETHPLLTPPDRLRSVMITLAGREGRLDLGFELLESANGTPGLECFVALAKTCARVGTIEQVLALFNKMGEAGFELKVDSYNQVLEELVVARKPLLQCLRLFAHMQQENVAPKRVTYTMLVTACHSGGSIKDAYAIFEGLEAARWDPDIKAFNALLYVCILYRDFKEARRVFWRMRETKRISFNPKSYELITRLCTDAGWGFKELLGPGYYDDAMGLYREMQTGERWPTLALYEELLRLMGACNNYGLAAQYYKDLREGAKLEASSAVYDALVNVDYRGDPQNPVRLLEAFRGIRYTPDLAFFEGMLGGYARVGAWQDAWLLLTVMPANGCTPTPEMFDEVSGLLTAAGGDDLAEQVRGALEKMRAECEVGGQEEGAAGPGTSQDEFDGALSDTREGVELGTSAAGGAERAEAERERIDLLGEGLERTEANREDSIPEEIEGRFVNDGKNSDERTWASSRVGTNFVGGESTKEPERVGAGS